MNTAMTTDIINADVLDAMADMPDASFDSCFCDPPYGISFMGKRWDHGVPSKDVWAEVLRVLKPGAFLMAFGGTRTQHRLVCAIEDAGFEIRDTICYIFGSGFPKSHNIGKAIDKAAGVEREVVGRGTSGETAGMQALGPSGIKGGDFDITAPATPLAQLWDGYGTALKPAYESIVVAMKPLDGTFANNAAVHGVAGLNIDAGRVGTEDMSGQWDRKWNDNNGELGKRYSQEGREKGKTVPPGRWPANIIHDGSEEATAGFPVTKDASAARYFYCCKASRAERNAGCEGLEAKTTLIGAERHKINPMTGKPVVDVPRQNIHPTVKPLSLCKYLATLTLPPERDTPRRLLVPFSGSGSEMIGALQAGWDHVTGIENDTEHGYIEIAEARIAHYLKSQADMLF
jgi:site-specific DNA-methyltransferase (adenine-specific)